MQSNPSPCCDLKLYISRYLRHIDQPQIDVVHSISLVESARIYANKYCLCTAVGFAFPTLVFFRFIKLYEYFQLQLFPCDYLVSLFIKLSYLLSV